MASLINSVNINSDAKAFFFSGDDARLFDDWDELLLSVRNKSFLHLPLWYRGYLQSYFSNDKDCIFVLLQLKGRPVAIFPLLYYTKSFGSIQIKYLELMWPTDMGVRDGIISAEVNINELADWLFQALGEVKIKWDIFLFPNIVRRSASYKFVTEQNQYHQYVKHHNFTARIPVQGNSDECLLHLSKRMRKRLATYYKNLQKKGEVGFRIVSGKNTLESYYETFLEVESDSWKGEVEAKTALKFDENQEKFYRHIYSNNSEAPVIAFLTLDGEVIAAKLCLLAGDTLNMMKIGYRKSLKDVYPGMLLLRHLMQFYAEDSRINYVGFVTNPKWADRWRPEQIEVYNAFLYNKSFVGKISRMARVKTEQARKVKQVCKNWWNSKRSG